MGDSALGGLDMKKLCTVAALIGVGMSAASAADLQPRMYAKAPPVPQVYDWSGFYVGVHVGAADGDITATDVTQPLGGFFTDLVPAGTEGFNFRNTSIAGGGHIGAQAQWQQFVFGVEGTWTGTGIKETIISPYFPESDTQTGKVKDLMTVVGRIGYAFDRFLVYAKGGYAGGHVDFLARDNEFLVTYQQKLWQNGYAVGGGLEYAITNGLILGVDYTHIDLGSKTATGPNVFDSGALGVNPETYQTKATVDMVVARLSYKFGGRSGF